MRRRIHRQLSALAVGLALTLVLAACGSSPATTSTPVAVPTADGVLWPTDGWHVSTPESEGVDSDQLASMFERIARANYAIDNVTIIRHGSIVADAYVPPYGPRKRHIVHSCTKSVVSTLIGIAIEESLISGVDVPLLALFEGAAVDNVDERKEALTLENTLTMATGMDAKDSYLYRWRGLTAMRESDDWTAHALSNPMVADPGTRFDYTNTGSYLLSSALQKATGTTTADYADQHLFGPLGITNYDWPTSPEGVNIGWGELWLTPHDMAKIGYLMLQDGKWEGTQLVPQQWVLAATTQQIAAGTLSDGYGYQWWVDDDGYFMALGYAGQYIVVLPDQDAVVVFTSALPDEQFFVPRDLVDQLIIPAMESDDPLPANPEAASRLAAATEAFAQR
ncbi:MAG: serine hydrolase [bacterium]|nr:serine hydrolase [bacterium]